MVGGGDLHIVQVSVIDGGRGEGEQRTYKGPRNALGFVQHALAAVEHGADLAVVARSLDGVLADHVDHLLVAFY